MNFLRRSRLEVVLNLEDDTAGGLYTKLNRALNAKPKELVVTILGGRLAPDDCLTLWDLMTRRCSATRLVVEAKGNLYDASLMLLLPADEIRVRLGVWWEASNADKAEEEEDESFFEFRDSPFRRRRRNTTSETPWDSDLKTAYREISRYLPLKELFDRRVALEMTLKDFGLLNTKQEELALQSFFKAA